MLLVWIDAWLKQLQAVALPEVEGIPLEHDIGLEHSLSLEFDGPAPVAAKVNAVEIAFEALLSEVALTVQPTGCRLAGHHFMAQMVGQQCSITQ